MLQLFLSYAHQDAALVQQLSMDLRRPDIEPWLDDKLKLAGVWNEEIDERIKGCNFFMPLLSRATQVGADDRFFRKEWQLALDAKRVFLPVRLQECELPLSLPKDLKAAIEDHQWVALFPSYEEGLRRILRFLHDNKRTGVFEESFSCLGPDNDDWRLGAWKVDEADSTGGNSQSLCGIAKLSPAALLPQAVRQTAAIILELPDRKLMLRYRRRLRVDASFGGSAEFRVVIDGEIVDSATRADSNDDEWTTRSVSVPDRGARRVVLEFIVTASSSLNYFSSATAWIDDLRIA